MKQRWARAAVAAAVCAAIGSGCRREEISSADAGSNPNAPATDVEVVGSLVGGPPSATTSPSNLDETPTTTGPAETSIPDEAESSPFCDAWMRWERSIALVLAGWVSEAEQQAAEAAAAEELAANPPPPSEPGFPAVSSPTPSAPASVLADPAQAGGAGVRAGDIEAAASPTMVASFFAMGVEWPEEAEELKAPVRSAYDPLFMRAQRATGALEESGATPDQTTAISEWWEVELVEFDGFNLPDIDSQPILVRNVVHNAGQKVTEREIVPYQEMALVVGPAITELYEYTALECPVVP